MVNPYQPGYPAAPPPPGPAWGAPPNFAGAQPFPRPGGGRTTVDIVAGIALVLAAVLAIAQSLWAGSFSGFWRYGSGVATIVFWVVAVFALVGGILVIAKGAADPRVRTVASLGTGALFLPFAQHIAHIFLSSFMKASEDGNFLSFPILIAVVVAAGALIAGTAGAAASPASAPGGRFPAAYPGGNPGYPAGAPFGASAPGCVPGAPAPAPYWQPPGAMAAPAGYAPGYPGGVPGVPGHSPFPAAQPPVAPGAVPAGGASSESIPTGGPGTGPDAQPTVTLGDK
ncbi:hypothetical protein [Nocardia nova]|uniref:hypothetical protein n=1 Tax=Nocardia nova TaxID=37330 RepID=UPI0034112E88